MTDEDIKIRHIRLCACGKLAGHTGECRDKPLSDDELFDAILEVAQRRGIRQLDARSAILKTEDRADLLRRWERALERETASILRRAEDIELDRMAVVNRARHQAVRTDAQRELFAKRRRMRLGQRLDAVLAAAAVMPGLATPDFVPSGQSAPSSSAPPDADHLDIEDDLTVIRSRLERMEEQLDAARGLAPARNWAMATSDEKDREILTQYRGVHSRVVSEANPALGSARTIERVRREAGLRPVNGLAKEDDTQSDIRGV